MASTSTTTTEDFLMTTKRKKQWFLDCGYSRHMTGDKSKFLDINKKDEKVVTFGDNNQDQIKGIGKIGDSNSA